MGWVSHTETTLKSICLLRARLRPRMRTKSRRALLRAWIGAAALLGLSAVATHANVLISIDTSTQQMLVSVDGVPHHRWPFRPAASAMARLAVPASILPLYCSGRTGYAGCAAGGDAAYLKEDVV